MRKTQPLGKHPPPMARGSTRMLQGATWRRAPHFLPQRKGPVGCEMPKAGGWREGHQPLASAEQRSTRSEAGKGVRAGGHEPGTCCEDSLCR